MPTKRALLLGFAAASLDLGAGCRAQEAYPSRAVRLVLPFPPGTNSEIVARVVADRLSVKFGQAVIVENRPGGAGGTIGAATVASAEPDGYTLLVSPPGPLVTAGAIYKNLNYDPGRSFAPVALLFEAPQLLAVSRNVPAKTVRELVAYIKANPGKISFASPGYGTQPHLLGEMFKAAADINIVHIPYKGPGAAITALLADDVQIYFESSTVVLPLAETGKLNVVAVAGESRTAQLPDTPTTGQSGFPTLLGGFWSGVVAPARTKAQVVNQLNAAINEVMQFSEVEATLAKVGAHARLGTPQDFTAFIDTERQRWSAVIKAAGIRVE